MSTGAQPESGGSSQFLYGSAMPLLALLFVVGLGLTYVQLSRNHDTLIERTAVQHAAVYSDTLDKFRELYASEVVETARKSNLRVTHDYLTEPNAIPLPITLSRKFEEQTPNGVTTTMYSPFPFNLDGLKKGGLKDQFGKDAWDALNRDPQTAFYRVEDYRGIPTLRYAIAETMNPQCVTCHNEYAGSPKTDWKSGDVRGVLEVNYPLDQAAALAERSIWESLAMLSPMLLLALVLLGMTTGHHRKHMEALEKRMSAQQKAQQTMAENADLRSRIDLQRRELLRSRLDVLSNEERLFQVVESMPLGVLLLDPDGNTKYANDHAVQILGDTGVFASTWQTESPIWHYPTVGTPYPDHLLPSSKALRGESTAATHLELQRGDARVPVLVSGAPIYDAAGDVAFAIVALQDISDEQRLEAKVRQAQRMEAVGRLAGGVAHDFNNQLTAIVNFATYAMEDLDESQPAYADLQQVMKSASRGEALTRQLLAFSRQNSVNPHVVEPNVTVTNIVKMLQALLGEDVKLQSKLAENLPNIRVSPGALDQVLTNCALNAGDAMPNGGVLTISTSSVTLDEPFMRRRGMELPAGEYVAFSVRDTGTGMDEETRRHMFDPFFTTKPVGKGTGFGLATCWGIVRQAGGHISVQTELGKGTEMTIYLPAVYETATAEGSSERRSGNRRQATVVIAEDDATIRESIVRLLRREGCKVLEAADGQEAADICGAMAPGTIDLLITDVGMPRMNGPDLVRAVSRRHHQMRILYISGYTDDTILELGLNQVEVELLQKPFTPDDLARKMWAVLDSTTPEQRGAS